MNNAFRRWLPCLTLATWSAILITFYFSGQMRDLLAPEFRIGALIAGVLMGAMALIFVFFPADAACCSAAECGHSLSRFATGKVLTFLILLVPITTAAMFSPTGFSANAVRNRGILSDGDQLPELPRNVAIKAPDFPLPSNIPGAAPSPTEPPKAPIDYLQRTPEGYIITEVLDLLYAAQDNELRKDFEGKNVQLIGQLMPDTANNANGKRFKAVRMFMTCCAADARPVATLVESEVKVDVPEMTWIKIIGTATFPIENGRRIGLLKAESVEKCPPPEESMLY